MPSRRPSPPAALRGDRSALVRTHRPASPRRTARSSTPTRPGRSTCEVDYVAADDRSGSSTVTLDVPTVGSRASGTGRAPGCADGCQITGLRRRSATPTRVFDDPELRRAPRAGRAGRDRDLLDHAWRPDPGSLERPRNDRFTRLRRPAAPVRGQPARRPRGRPSCPTAAGPRCSTRVGPPVRSWSPTRTSRLPSTSSGDDRSHRRRRGHHPAAARHGRRAHRPRTAAVGVRPDGARARRSASWPPRTPPTTLLDRLIEATGSRRSRSRTSATRSGQAARRRPGPGLRPDGRGLRPGRAARPGGRRGPAPAQLPPRRGVAARPRHRPGHRPPGRSRRARSPRGARRGVPSSPAAGSRSSCCSAGSRCSTLPPAALPLDTSARALALCRPGGPRRGRRAGGRRPGPRRTRHHHATQPAAGGGGPMNSPHDVLLLRCAPPNNAVGTPR